MLSFNRTFLFFLLVALIASFQVLAVSQTTEGGTVPSLISKGASVLSDAGSKTTYLSKGGAEATSIKNSISSKVSSAVSTSTSGSGNAGSIPQLISTELYLATFAVAGAWMVGFFGFLV